MKKKTDRKKPDRLKAEFPKQYTVAELCQALHDDLVHYGITHVSGASLYFRAVNEHGQVLTVRDQATGRPVTGWTSDGPYHSAADEHGA